MTCSEIFDKPDGHQVWWGEIAPWHCNVMFNVESECQSWHPSM